MDASDIVLVIQTVVLATTAWIAARSARNLARQSRLAHETESLRRHTRLLEEKMAALQRVADSVAEIGGIAADLSARYSAELVNRVPLAQAKLSASLASVRYGAWRLDRCHELAEADTSEVLRLSRAALVEVAEALAGFQSSWDSPPIGEAHAWAPQSAGERQWARRFLAGGSVRPDE